MRCCSINPLDSCEKPNLTLIVTRETDYGTYVHYHMGGCKAGKNQLIASLVMAPIDLPKPALRRIWLIRPIGTPRAR
jgi:hypothetical protein